MISHRTVLCSLAALLSLAVISYAQPNYASKLCMSDHTTRPCDLSTSRIPTVSCVAPTFPQCLVDDSPVIRCGDSAASKDCTEMLQQYDDEDTRADCYAEICSNCNHEDISHREHLHNSFKMHSRVCAHA